jgi:hypothetical protein
MDALVSLPGAIRDNAGLVSVPATIPSGCRGAACPAFALCQGRCKPEPPSPLALMVQAYGRQVAEIGR